MPTCLRFADHRSRRGGYMSSTLPDQPNLVQLKKQAKELQSAQGVPLSQAQLSLAREFGFSSWTKLRTHVLQQELFKGLVIPLRLCCRLRKGSGQQSDKSERVGLQLAASFVELRSQSERHVFVAMGSEVFRNVSNSKRCVLWPVRANAQCPQFHGHGTGGRPRGTL